MDNRSPRALPGRHGKNWFALQLIAMIPLALLVSCAHTARYAAPDLPPNQLAVLEISAPVWIVSLDGQAVASATFSDRTRVKVSPGPHQVEVSYRRLELHSAPPPVFNGPVYNAQEVSSSIQGNRDMTQYSLHNRNVNFVAKAGATYDVDAGLTVNSWNPTITEVTPAK